MTSAGIAFDPVTDDVVLGGSEQNIVGAKYVPTEMDCLLLIAGARDYNYLMFENSGHTLDHECTSLFPICSFNMLQFILFLICQKSPRMAHLFRFRKDKEYGVCSDVFHGLVIKPPRKQLPNSVSERPLEHLKMPTHFLITPQYTLPRTEKSPISNRYTRLFLEREGTRMLTNRKYPVRLKLEKLVDLEHIFKTDVLFYMPRFYQNHYQNAHDELARVSNILRIMGMADPSNDYEMPRASFSSPISYSDRKKREMRMDLDGDTIAAIHSNIKRFFADLGLKGEIPSLEEETKRYLGILKGEEMKSVPIVSKSELDEFFLKSILIRRPPHVKINTPANMTNGVYLLKNGVNRFRELVLMEVLNNPEEIMGNRSRPLRKTQKQYNIMDHVYVGPRSIELRYGDRKTKRLKMSEVIDLSNKPFLLSKKFMRLVDRIYGKHEIHHLIKYAQIYTKVFNHMGERGVWFFLGTELADHTDFDYSEYLTRVARIRAGTHSYTKNQLSFQRFEEMVFGARQGVYRHIPKRFHMRQFVKYLLWSRIYDWPKAVSTYKKFMVLNL